MAVKSTKVTRVKLPPGSPGLKAKLPRKKSSDLEDMFADLWAQFGDGPTPIRELLFIPGRRFRLDFAWPESRVGVELEGATLGRPVKCHKCGTLARARKGDGSLGGQLRVGGAHSTGEGVQRDCQKNNLALSQGWAILRFTSKDVKERGKACVDQVAELIKFRKSDQPAISQMSFLKEF